MRLTKAEVEAGLAHLEHQFMTPQIWQEQAIECCVRDEHDGPITIPVSFYDADRKAYADPEPAGLCWFAMLSASGYMDRTDPCAFDTEQEAAEYLVETYADDIDYCEACNEAAAEVSAESHASE